MTSLTVLLPQEGESWSQLLKRAEDERGELLIVLTGYGAELESGAKERDAFLSACARLGGRARFAVREKVLITGLRSKGLRIIDRVTDFRMLLEGHPMLPEALRAFSPHVWQQQIRSRLQSMGLLSVPKLRIWFLTGISAMLFFFVLFWLLPSAQIRVWPREDTVSQTANVWLVQSGSTVEVPTRVRTMELRPIRVEVTRSFTFDQVSKDFVGENSHGDVAVVNKANELYSLRKGTRIANNAGMIFLLLDPVNVEPGEEVIARVEAADVDLYGEIIGERGNVPAGLEWEFLGLAPDERTKVYAENRTAFTGGKTSFRTVLHEKDLDTARKQLEQELLATAKQLVDEEKTLHNTQEKDSFIEILYYDELTRAEFHDFDLPRQFLGEAVTSVPVQGSLTYTAYAYDAQHILNMLKKELEEHVGVGKRLLPDTISMDRLVAHVIDYSDDLSWIKLTVDLSGTEQFILDPLTPAGAKFSKKVRELVTGLTTEEALRILRNLPEVDNADIRLWPPWNSSLPRIPAHITIETLLRSSSAR
ncbi:hypothetical protein A2881_01490 [Candidatus Peribacteria bacterium RIFCSPHIGHO2_01_FULL_55_13]|nr:MAG: hypothetical protein A2881_01490 [Candidatus Peribacteria bacterium RIFCSPHIGHO2_01_FULL_55_13]